MVTFGDDMRVVGVATLIVAGVVACGYALQMLALPQPGKGDVVAVGATRWLSRYRGSRAEVDAGGRWLRASCVHGWIGRRRGTLLRLSDGSSIVDLPPHTLDVDGRPVRRPVAMLETAGCTRVLADRLAIDAEFVGNRPARLVHVAGAVAYAVRFPNLTVYVSRRTARPLGVSTRWFHGIFRLVAA
jgi:hypothetical protein